MTPPDVLLLIIRWIHAVSAAAWVGGGIFYLLVLRPAMRRAQGPGPVLQAVHREYQGLTDVLIAALLLTGAVMSVAQVTSPDVGLAYVGTLALKIVLSLYSFALVLLLRRGRPIVPGTLGRIIGGSRGVVVVGVVIILVADVLSRLHALAVGG